MAGAEQMLMLNDSVNGTHPGRAQRGSRPARRQWPEDPGPQPASLCPGKGCALLRDAELSEWRLEPPCLFPNFPFAAAHTESALGREGPLPVSQRPLPSPLLLRLICSHLEAPGALREGPLVNSRLRRQRKAHARVLRWARIQPEDATACQGAGASSQQGEHAQVGAGKASVAPGRVLAASSFPGQNLPI